jgi:integrase
MFFLDRPNSDKPTYVFIQLTLSDGLFKRSLSIKLLPAHWSQSRERAEIANLDSATVENNKSINTLIGKLETFIEGRQRDARYNENHLTKAELSKRIEDLTGKKRSIKGTGFYIRCRSVIEDMSSGKLLTWRGKKFSAGTIKNYNQSLNTIELYDPKIRFEQITMDFYRGFIKHCNDKDFSLNYIGQHIKNLRCLMKETFKAGYHNNKIYLDEDFAVIQEETDDISLDQAELDIIYNKRLIDPAQDLARDWFIIDCYTGLRVGDIQLLEGINFSKDYMQLVNNKTGVKVMVPLRSEIKAILKKWKGLPPKITDVEINRRIKEVCELCKINGTVLYFLTKGGKRRDFYLKKYEMVSNHTARRSFITNLLNLAVPDNQVMQLAGIKKHSTLMRYKKTKPEQNAEIMKGHEFFR